MQLFSCRPAHENGLSIVLSGSFGTAAHLHEHRHHRHIVVESELLFVPLSSDNLALAARHAVVRVSLFRQNLKKKNHYCTAFFYLLINLCLQTSRR